MDEKTLKQLQQYLGKINGEFVTKEEFVKAFQIFKTVLQEMKRMMEDNSFDMKVTATSTIEKQNSTIKDIESNVKNVSKYLDKISYLEKEIKRIETIIPPSTDLTPLETKIEDAFMELENKIPEIPEEYDDTELKDKLEALAKEIEDKLQIVNEKISNISSSRVGVSIPRLQRGYKFSFTGDASTTEFYLPTDVAGKAMFIWAHYQGQWLQQDVHYTLSGKLMDTSGGTNPLGAPQNGSIIEGFIIAL